MRLPSRDAPQRQLAALVLRMAQEAAGKSAGELIDRMPFTWKGPRSGRIETDTTEEFECAPAAKLPVGTRLHAEGSRQGDLEPDTACRLYPGPRLGSAGSLLSSMASRRPSTSGAFADCASHRAW
jgi:hypothetical protein